MQTWVERVKRLFSPRSIALVGATENSNWSVAIVNNLRNLGYPGSVYLVHPTKSEQFGARCYPSVRDLPEPVDHAWIMTPTSATMSVLADCAARGVRSATLLTAGFSEAGPEGAALEEEVVRFCRKHDITLLGPNCLGFVNARERIPAYALILEEPIPGHVGIVLQSGAMLIHAYRLAVRRSIGLSYLISSGNEAMVDATDCLEFMVEDPDTRVVAALLEGIRQPERFRRIAERAMELGKPMVVLKTGRSDAASRSAAAHTGALTGDDRIVDAFLRQLGVIRVYGVEELVETAGLLAARGWPESGRRAGVVTPSGGACGIFADLCQGTSIELPDFSAETKAKLREILPAFGTPQNPLDTTGYVVLDPTLIPRTIEVISSAPEVDFMVVGYDVPADPGPYPARTAERLQLMSDAVRKSKKWICLMSSVTGELTPFARGVVSQYGLHATSGLALGAAALDKAVRYGEVRRRYLARKQEGALHRPAGRSQYYEDGHRPTGTLDEYRSKSLLVSAGIPIPHETVVRDVEGAVAAAAEIDGPVVLKILSADIPHKTEAGGVALGLTTPEQVREAYHRIMDSARAYKPDAQIDGVLVAEQVTGGVEMLAGISVDPTFGPVVVVGLGGIFVEVLKDVSMRLPPFDKAEALAMLDELRGRKILDGVRGRPAADVDALAETLVRLGGLALELGDDLLELDINPLVVLPAGKGVRALDALAIFKG